MGPHLCAGGADICCRSDCRQARVAFQVALRTLRGEQYRSCCFPAHCLEGPGNGVSTDFHRAAEFDLIGVDHTFRMALRARPAERR